VLHSSLIQSIRDRAHPLTHHVTFPSSVAATKKEVKFLFYVLCSEAIHSDDWDDEAIGYDAEVQDYEVKFWPNERTPGNYAEWCIVGLCPINVSANAHL
jgi:hypothetical protein